MINYVGFYHDYSIGRLSDCCSCSDVYNATERTKNHKTESEHITETMNRLEMSFNNAIHEQESNIAEAINNNTLVIQKLIDKLDKD